MLSYRNNMYSAMCALHIGSKQFWMHSNTHCITCRRRYHSIMYQYRSLQQNERVGNNLLWDECSACPALIGSKILPVQSQNMSGQVKQVFVNQRTLPPCGLLPRANPNTLADEIWRLPGYHRKASTSTARLVSRRSKTVNGFRKVFSSDW